MDIIFNTKCGCELTVHKHNTCNLFAYTVTFYIALTSLINVTGWKLMREQ
jgi:hypothetical protein